MKTIKLRVVFDGNYGGSVDEYILLPLDANGVLFEELKEGTYKNEISLGEIEGKHSECYGDLIVEVVDLENYSVNKITDLINNSYFGEFEGYFEMQEEDLEDVEDEVDILLNRHSVDKEKVYILTEAIHDNFIKSLKSKYVEEFRSITVLELDYEKALKSLSDNNIRTYE